MFKDFFKRSPSAPLAKAVADFHAQVRVSDGAALGITWCLAAECAGKTYEQSNGRVDLRQPKQALVAEPGLTYRLTEDIHRLQRAGRQFEAPGMILWTQTMWAEQLPELRPSVTEIWQLVECRSFIHRNEAVQSLEQILQRSLARYQIYLITPPEGYHAEPGNSKEVLPSASASCKKVTDQSFQADVLDSKIPVVVHFCADWCGPCRMIAPSLDELANEYDGRATVAKMNIDEDFLAAVRYGVRGIPALMIFNGGQVVATHVGASPKTKIKEWIDASI